MRRGIHISVALAAVFLLLKPFDCFGGGEFTQKAADCCQKGRCLPSSNADDCCKGTLPGGKQLVAPKAPPHAAPVSGPIVSAGPASMIPALPTLAFGEVNLLTGSPLTPRLNLPLLI